MNSIHDDERVRKILTDARATLERTKLIHARPAPIVVFEKAYDPEPEPERHYKLDTNILGPVENRLEFLEAKIADVFSALSTYMENVNREWAALKSRTAAAEKALSDLEKNFSEYQRKVSLDLRAVELGHMSDILSLREARPKEPAHEQSNSRAVARR